MRHLNLKKVSSVHDDSALDFKDRSDSNVTNEEDPFANVSASDFTFAKENKVKLLRR